VDRIEECRYDVVTRYDQRTGRALRGNFMTMPGLSEFGDPNAPQASRITAVDDNDIVPIRDFSLARRRVKFKVDDDIFEAYTVLGAATLQVLSQLSDSVSKMGNMKAGASVDMEPIAQIFDELLTSESAQRMRVRLTARGDDALDIRRQLMPIIYMLLEEYGVRPTQLSSDSSAGSPSETDGTASTVGVQHAELTQRSS